MADPSIIPAWLQYLVMCALAAFIVWSSICRMWMLDHKRDRTGFAAVFLALAVGALFTVAGLPWGPILLLLGVALHHALTRRFWLNDSPHSTRKGPK